uniref:Secreted protein n=1 Tax=Anguilla anguilla TaxID=7936 RepID=A0A0E9Y2A8_ANGAN
MNFLCFLWRKLGSAFLHAELLLRVTGCKNEGKTTHQKDCKFTEPTRLMNCRFCTDDLNHLETSFIHCDWQRNASKHAERRKNGCEKYDPGQGTSLALKDLAPECLGCL